MVVNRECHNTADGISQIITAPRFYLYPDFFIKEALAKGEIAFYALDFSSNAFMMNSVCTGN
jgi:hypothetical protein